MIYSVTPWEVLLHSTVASAVREEKLDIVSVPMAENVSSSLEKFLTSQLLALENSGSVHHVISVRKATKTFQLFNLHLSWWSITSVFLFIVIRLSKIPSFLSAFWRPSSDQNHWQQWSFCFGQLLFGGHN